MLELFLSIAVLSLFVVASKKRCIFHTCDLRVWSGYIRQREVPLDRPWLNNQLLCFKYTNITD